MKVQKEFKVTEKFKDLLNATNQSIINSSASRTDMIRPIKSELADTYLQENLGNYQAGSYARNLVRRRDDIASVNNIYELSVKAQLSKLRGDMQSFVNDNLNSVDVALGDKIAVLKMVSDDTMKFEDKITILSELDNLSLAKNSLYGLLEQQNVLEDKALFASRTETINGMIDNINEVTGQSLVDKISTLELEYSTHHQGRFKDGMPINGEAVYSHINEIQLSESEEGDLSLGLNFVPTPVFQLGSVNE